LSKHRACSLVGDRAVRKLFEPQREQFLALKFKDRLYIARSFTGETRHGGSAALRTIHHRERRQIKNRRRLLRRPPTFECSRLLISCFPAPCNADYQRASE